MLIYQKCSWKLCFIPYSFPSLITFHVPLHSHFPFLCHFLPFLCFVFSTLLKKQKNNIIYYSREDSCKLALTSSLSLPCHNGVSKDKLLQPTNKTKQKGKQIWLLYILLPTLFSNMNKEHVMIKKTYHE